MLEPGGVFAGTDSVDGGLLFALAHIGDINVPIDPETLGVAPRGRRLRARVDRVAETGVAAKTVRFRGPPPGRAEPDARPAKQPARISGSLQAANR